MHYRLKLSLTAALVFIVSATSALFADTNLDDKFPPPEGTSEKSDIQKYEAKLKSVREELELTGQAVPNHLRLDDDGIAFYFDQPYFAQYRIGQMQDRFLVGRLVILNQSDETYSLQPRTIKLLADGRTYEYQSADEFKGHAALKVNGGHYNVKEFPVAEELEVEPGAIASTWVVFFGMDAGNDVPKLILSWQRDEKNVEFDTRQISDAKLKLRTEQIGPQGVIAICTVQGEVDSVNLGLISRSLVDLAFKNVARVIIHFDDDAPEVDRHLMEWFVNGTKVAGRSSYRTNYWEFAPLPPIIQEMHVSLNPDHNVSYSRPSQGQMRIHESLVDAVIAASHSIYQTAPYDVLLSELRDGHRLSRCAALIFGSERLPPTFWPELIQILKSTDDVELKKAALIGLGEFPKEEPIRLLKEYTEHETEALSEAALTSLAR